MATSKIRKGVPAMDPYQPAEAAFEVTRRLLEAARAVPGLRLSITTKSTLIARDAALLAELGRRAEISVNFSVPTVDAALARRLEPRAPRPDLRLGAMEALASAGVTTRLFMMPILPRLTDGEANLAALLAAGRAAGAAGAVSGVLFLRPGTREVFFAFLRAEYPALVPEYARLYAGGAYARADYLAEVESRVRRLADVVGFSVRRLPPRLAPLSRARPGAGRWHLRPSAHQARRLLTGRFRCG